MPARVAPTARVKFRDRATRYSRPYRGWGACDIMSELSGEMAEHAAEGDSITDYRGMIANHWEVDGKKQVPAVQLVPDPVNAMIVTPWPRAGAQRLDLTAFDPIGDWPEAWTDYLRDEAGMAINTMTNCNAPLLSGTVGYTGVRSLFALPRNPAFAVRLYRTLPSDEATPLQAQQLKTTIDLGILTDDLRDEIGETIGAQVQIVVPYEGPIRLWWKHQHYTGNKWREMLGDTRDIQWSSINTGPFPNAVWATLWIGCFRSGVVVSGDRFADDFTYARFPIVESAQDPDAIFGGHHVDGNIPDVQAGFVEVRHNAGMWLFGFIPLFATAGGQAQLYGPLHDAGYADPGFYAEETILQSRTRMKTQPSTVASDAKVQVEDVSGTEDSKRAKEEDTTYREWRATFVATEWSHDFVRAYGALRTINGTITSLPLQRYQTAAEDPLGGLVATFESHVSPELYSVNMAEFPIVAGTGVVGSTQLATVGALGYSAPHYESMAECQLVLDNRMAEHRELRKEGAREVTVELGYVLDDDTTEYSEVLTGIIRLPMAEQKALGSGTVQPFVLDFTSLLARGEADGTLPCFDGWPVWRAYQFLLRRAGFSDDEMGIAFSEEGNYTVDMTDVTKGIEDTRVKLSVGPPEEPIWLAEPGRPIAALLRNIGEFDYDAAFWFAPDGTFTTGCRYCRRRRDGSDATGPQHPMRHTEPDVGAHSSGCLAYDVVRAGNASGIDHDVYSPVAELVASGVEFFGNEILSLRVTNFNAQRQDFANRVVVTTSDRRGPNTLTRRGLGGSADPISAVFLDLASIEDPTAENYAHGEATATLFDESLVTQAEVNRRCRVELARLSTSTERIEVVLPLKQNIRKGHVFRVHHGNGLDIDHAVYRTEYVEHDVPTQAATQCETRVGGVYLRTEAPV